jgi:hypothetical protein
MMTRKPPLTSIVGVNFSITHARGFPQAHVERRPVFWYAISFTTSSPDNKAISDERADHG